MLSSQSTYSDFGDVKQMAFTKSAAVRLFCVVMVYFEALSTIFSRVKVLHELSEHTTLDHYQSTKFSYNCTASVNCWQYPWGQSSFYMHSDLLYHSLMHSFHPLSTRFNVAILTNRHWLLSGK